MLQAYVPPRRPAHMLAWRARDPYVLECDVWVPLRGKRTLRMAAGPRTGSESRPFDPPRTGKIAVKVNNHYGDEVLKGFEIG